jgi:hypothetical protein
MSVCLATEGIILLFSGFPFPGLPPLLYVVGILWALTCVAVFFFKKRPYFALALGWLLFAVNAGDMWFHSAEEKTLVWFLYQHSLELAFIAVAHIGHFFVLRGRRGTMRAVANPRSL